MPCICLAGIVAASAGCGRPAVVAPSGDGLSAAEPSPHSAKDADKEADAAPFQFPDDAGGALLAKGLEPLAAVRGAKEFIGGAIEHSLEIGHGHGPVNPMFKDRM